MAASAPAEPRLTGAILAGGAGRRMGGEDKGLITFRDRPLIAWVIEALAPQVDELIIVANRNLDIYRGFGYRVVSDLRQGFAGPLAGFEAALTHARHDWVLTAPADTPLLPPDYAALMATSGLRHPCVATVAQHWQPVFCLLPRTALPALQSDLDAGQRRVREFLARLVPDTVSFDHCAAALRDADTPADLDALTPRGCDR